MLKSLLTFAALLVVAFVHAVAAPVARQDRAATPQDSPAEYAALKQEAERAVAEHSYAVARDLYQRAAALNLSPADKRWVEFRLADTTWRAQAGTETHDSTIYDRAHKQLEDLIRMIERVEDRDIVWAEASESLGDFFWARGNAQDWGRAWPHYSNALDYWAGSADIDAARPRYLHIVWTMSEPQWMQRDYWNFWAHVPLEILDNALKVAQSDNDKARANYLIALTIMRQRHDWPAQMRLERIFQGALAPGKNVEWHDDILYGYAEWLMNQGRPVVLDDGQMTRKRDYVKALELLKQLVEEYRKGETQFWDNAQAMIKDITSPVVGAGVSNFFLPNSQVQYALSWRNVKTVNLALWKVNLTEHIKFRSGTQEGIGNWLSAIDLGGAEKVKTWTKDTGDKGDHEPGQSMEKLEEPLPPGAYVIEASGDGGQKARDLILISDTAVVLKTAGNQVLTWAVNAVDSTPVPNAKVRIWKAVWRGENRRWDVADTSAQTDGDGLCVFSAKDFPNLPAESGQYFAAIESDQRQAMAHSQSNAANPTNEGWRIYAFTDRPAYRPTEKVEWKIIARQQQREGWSTPAGSTLYYEITDPRSTKMSEGTLTLNEFGGAWASKELTSQMPLGEYAISFWLDQKHLHHVGDATLFRLEEYKLPEFQVAVSTPLENGKRKAYLLGEYVEATIQADYYFGGPVANATVEVVVKQGPYYRWWTWPREYPWCYEDQNPYRWYYGGGQVIKQETLRTDATGKAVVTFETPANQGQDLQYTIEARVTDSSRREITGSDTVRVTQHRYYVHARAEHNILRPNDEAAIEFAAIDANDQPWQTEGNVCVTREIWKEIWLDPSGREITGIELAGLRREQIFPPLPPRPDLPPWRLKFCGYESEEILKTKVQLDEQGKARFTFTPQKEGYYRVQWNSPDPGTAPVTTETYVWVATDKSTDLNYRYGGLQVILDKDTVRSGETVPVMIATPTNNRYVLFSVEGFDLYSYQVVHVTGDVKLLNVPIQQSYVPNVWFSALMAHDGQMHADSKEVIVPPVDEYLNVEVTADRSQYQPGEDGTFTIKATDHNGKPARAEVAIAVVDESVTYIQQDYSGDPRPFFFQQRQWNIVQGGSTFNQKSFVRLVKGEKDQFLDEKLAEAETRRDQDGAMSFPWQEGVVADELGAFAGGRGAGAGGLRDRRSRMSMDAAAPPAPASAAPGGEMARSEMRMLEKSGTKTGGVFGEPGEDPQRLGEEPAVQVRTDFRSTLLWNPSVVTDETGIARVNLKFADSLTTWKATARAAGTTAQFGIANASVRTRMPLIARLQAPRFFLVGDTVTISGVINNNTEDAMSVRPEIKIEGLNLLGRVIDRQISKDNPPIEIAANSEARVDWQVQVDTIPAPAGEAKIILTARSDKHADAMEKTYQVYEHGMQRFNASAGKVRGNDVTVTLNIPAARKPETTVMNVQVTSSMAVTMLDALPYLIDYPYGCTEQTMSRFLPAVITAKTLSDLGVKPESIMGKVFGGIEQQFADKTRTHGKRDLKELERMTQESLDRLYDFQHADGGWGWWKEGESDHFMTAYVVWGFALAKEAGLDVRQDVMDRGAAFLNQEIIEEENAPDMQAWMLHAISKYRQVMKQNPHEFETKALATIFSKREQLNAYTRALAALSAHQMNDVAKAKTLIDNLRNGVKRDDRPDTSVIVAGVQGENNAVIGTAHWGEDGVWWRWSDGGVEATAFALRALLAIDPKSDLIEPVTNWLIKNRRGAQWSNTRDTAIVVFALNDYLRASGELAPDMEYELLVNGTSIATKKLSAADALSAPSLFAIDRTLIRDGDNQIRILRKSGTGPIYFSAQSEFYSLEEPIPPAGNEIFVRREYYKLVPTPTLLKGVIYDRQPLSDGDNVKSGERVEVVLTIESKNNYEYLVFEDLKPAGLEAVAVRSGEPLFTREMKSGAVEKTFGEGERSEEDVRKEQGIGGHEDYTGQQRWVYQELRDRKVAMFIDRLPEGVWEIRYDLRAETPGKFHALPVLGHAMYVPEIRCNGKEIRIGVTE